MALTTSEVKTLFEKIDSLKEASVRIDERTANIREDIQEMKQDFKDHETLGSSQYQGLRNETGRLKGRMALLEARRTGKRENPLLTWRGFLIALTGLVTAATAAFAAFRM